MIKFEFVSKNENFKKPVSATVILRASKYFKEFVDEISDDNNQYMNILILNNEMCQNLEGLYSSVN